MTQNKIHKKFINNAISAYFMLLISGLFLFNKKNEYLNNDFVKSHTKIAFFIHLLFLLNYIIFISFGFLKNIILFGYNLNYILASSIFTILFILLLFGIYKASKEKFYKIGEIINIGETHKIVDINGDGKIGEKDKLTLILSYIPFLGYYIQGKYYKNKLVYEIIKFNLFISTIIALIYISGNNNNITLLFILFYIIFAVFSSINIVVGEKLISINPSFIKTPGEYLLDFKILSKYILNYLGKDKFLKYEEVKKQYLEKNLKFKNKNLFKINLIMLILFFIIFFILIFYGLIPNNSYIILIFPLFFLIGYYKNKPDYKIPIIYDFYEFLISIKNIFIKTKKVIKEKQAEVHSETIKVGELKK